MVDLSSYNIEISNHEEYADTRQPQEIFYERLTEFGLKSPPHIVEGQIVRVPDEKDKGPDKSGWYVFRTFQDDARSVPVGTGTFGTWHEIFPTQHFCSKSSHSFTPEERERYEAARKAMQDSIDADRRIKNDEAKVKAQSMWEEAQENFNHEYLRKKKIKPYGIKQLGGDLLIPIRENGEIVSLQRILPDGQKRFLSGGKIKGCYGTIEGATDRFYVCEGYSTANSIHEATGATVHYAMNAGNLYEAIGNISDRPLTICADNDITSPVNVGVNKAEQAAKAYNLEYIVPLEENDFNDMHVLHGLDAVKAQLEYKPEPKPKEKEKKGSFDEPPPLGILADMAAYYNATSGNDQPLFAVQTALAIASTVCARSFKSNYGNFSSMYFLNIAKSSTGKEHVKSTIQSILSAADCVDLLVGEGYTSKGAVFSALLGKPRHLTIIDEFGRFMEAARKAGNSMQMEMNTQLMQAISGVGGIMQSQVYSSMTGGKEKTSKAEAVYNPAITLAAMTTPSTFWDNMDVNAIKDGFLNRFVIAISDTPRTIRKHKEPVEVPQKIIDWIKIVHDRKPEIDIATQKQTQELLTITQNAFDMQEGFQQECINVSNELEAYGMAEISGRTNEMAMRIALINALARNPRAEFIDDTDMQWGIDYMRNRLTRLVGDLRGRISGSEYEKAKMEILDAFKVIGEIKLKDMHKTKPFSKYNNKDLKEILEALVDCEAITVEDAKPEGRGRPTKLYKRERA